MPPKVRDERLAWLAVRDELSRRSRRGPFTFVRRVFGNAADRVAVSSTKSMTGHLLGAAGAIEAIASILAMEHNLVPPTINHTTVDEEIDPKLNLTLNKAQEREVRVAMSNTFGFGGHNACVLLKKIS